MNGEWAAMDRDISSTRLESEETSAAICLGQYSSMGGRFASNGTSLIGDQERWKLGRKATTVLCIHQDTFCISLAGCVRLGTFHGSGG